MVNLGKRPLSGQHVCFMPAQHRSSRLQLGAPQTPLPRERLEAHTAAAGSVGAIAGCGTGDNGCRVVCDFDNLIV
jgi:hypothetical protein